MAEDVVVEIGFEESEVIEQQAATNTESCKPTYEVRMPYVPHTTSLVHHCFSCLEPHKERSFSLKNRKCKTENLYFKLQTFLGELELVDKLYECNEAAICPSCCRKINFVHNFHQKLKMGIKAYVASCGAQSNQYAAVPWVPKATVPMLPQVPKRTNVVVNINYTPGSTPEALSQDMTVPCTQSAMGRTSLVTVRPGGEEKMNTECLEDKTDLSTSDGDLKGSHAQSVPSIHAVPSEDHAYPMTSLKKPVEIDSDSTESDSGEDNEAQSSAFDQSDGDLQVTSTSELTQREDRGNINQSSTASVEKEDLVASIKINPFVRWMDNVEDVGTELKKMVPRPGTFLPVKSVESQTRVETSCSEEKETAAKSTVPTPFRHYDSIQSFGKMTFMEKGSHLLDITKQPNNEPVPTPPAEDNPAKSNAPYIPIVHSYAINEPVPTPPAEGNPAKSNAPYIPIVHSYAIDETSQSSNHSEQNNSFEEEFYAALEIAVLSRDMFDIVNVLTTHKAYVQRIKGLYVQTVQLECQELSVTKQIAGKGDPSSILRKVNSLAALANYKDYVAEIFSEMKKRCPFLLDIMVAVCGSHPTSLPVENIGPITTAYAVLMKARLAPMTGWHKMVNCVLQHGYLEERMLVVLNHIGIAQCSTSRARLLEKVADDKEENLAKIVKQYPFAKIACDISVRPCGPSPSESDNNEIQVLAASLILVKDIDPSLDNSPQPFPYKMLSTTFIPTSESFDRLQSAYAVLVGRVIKDLPGLSWLTVPDHIPHSRSAFTAQRTEIHSLPMSFCWETKRNEGVKVLQSLQDSLLQLYNKGSENGVEVERTPVPVGADQMSRAQLEFARRRKVGKVPQKDRFKHLGPFVTEFWHNKKEFVVKAFQALYNKKSLYQHGTLYSFKSKFQLAFVTGNVEKNFEAHYDLLMYLGQCLIREQAMEYFGIGSEDETASENVPQGVEAMSQEEKLKVSQEVLKKYIQHFGYASLVFSDYSPQRKTYEVKSVLPNGKYLLVEVPEKAEDADEVYNYSMQLTHWVLHLMEMEDTAREGDAERLVLDTQYCLPFFYSFSPFSNQLTENVDFLIKIKHTLSPLMRELVLRTAFVNFEGGKGKCCEADYAHDQCVRNQKSIVKHLDTIATDRMVRQSSGAADVICKITDNAAHSLRVLKKKTKASKYLTEKQKEAIHSMLRTLRPFKNVPGRQCSGFRDIEAYPFKKASRGEMFKRLDCIVGRLRRGEGLETSVDEGDDTEPEQTPEPPVKRKRSKKTDKSRTSKQNSGTSHVNSAEPMSLPKEKAPESETVKMPELGPSVGINGGINTADISDMATFNS